MATYAVVSGGFTVNTIVWDGKTPYNPGSGITVVPVISAPPPLVVSGGVSTPDPLLVITATVATLQVNNQFSSAQATAVNSGSVVNSGGTAVTSGHIGVSA